MSKVKLLFSKFFATFLFKNKIFVNVFIIINELVENKKTEIDNKLNRDI